MGASTSHNPKGIHGLLQGELYHYRLSFMIFLSFLICTNLEYELAKEGVKNNFLKIIKLRLRKYNFK
jgi:hypothetical protein